MDEVLKLALTKPLTAIEWDEVDGVEAVSGGATARENDPLLTH